jgi:pimeloyl-ACP methyl ester carboxylesterase
MAFQNPVIVIPGITGTSLDDEYPLDRDAVWTAVLNKEYERIALHPDDLRYEAVEPARVVRGQPFELVYGELVRALRHDLSVRADQPTPVFSFPYDWRQPIEDTARGLAGFVSEVLARTRLLRHYKGWPAKRQLVDLVGHSMGGLVIAEYLAQCQAAPDPTAHRVRKLATLGTPHRGAVDAIVKLTTGLASLGGETPSERERESARTTPAVYQLVATYDGAIESAEAVDILDAASWQSGVVESLAEFVRLRAVDPPASKPAQRTRGRQLLQQMLERARQLRARSAALELAALGLAPDAWLTVAGTGADTRATLGWERSDGGPRFKLRAAKPNAGDGTVPIAGAVPPFLPRESVVGVRPDDFEWFELKDKVLLRAAGFHAQLPNMNLAQRLVLRHLREDYRGVIWGRPLPGVPRAAWRPAIPRESDAVPNGIRDERP